MKIQNSKKIVRNSPKFSEIPERNSVSADHRDFTGKRNGLPWWRRRREPRHAHGARARAPCQQQKRGGSLAGGDASCVSAAAAGRLRAGVRLRGRAGWFDRIGWVGSGVMGSWCRTPGLPVAPVAVLEPGFFFPRLVNPNRRPPVPVYRTGWTGNRWKPVEFKSKFK